MAVATVNLYPDLRACASPTGIAALGCADKLQLHLRRPFGVAEWTQNFQFSRYANLSHDNLLRLAELIPTDFAGDTAWGKYDSFQGL